MSLNPKLLTEFQRRVLAAVPLEGESVDVDALVRDFIAKYRTSHHANVRRSIAALCNQGFLHRSMAGYVRRTGEGA